MRTHLALLRGINVGGRNAVGMADLVSCFQDAGFADASTHAQSGNVLFSAPSNRSLEAHLQDALEKRFGLPILTIVRSRDELAAIVDAAPSDHGSRELRSEVFFLKHPLIADEALAEMPALREGVDAVAAGPGVIYFSRVKALARKTRITGFMSLPVFKQMTVRTWGTTTRLLELLDA